MSALHLTGTVRFDRQFSTQKRRCWLFVGRKKQKHRGCGLAHGFQAFTFLTKNEQRTTANVAFGSKSIYQLKSEQLQIKPIRSLLLYDYS